MGWLFYDAKHYTERGKVDRKAECDSIYTWEDEKYKTEVVKSAMKGRVYYAAIRQTDKQTGKSQIQGNVTLTSSERGGFNFGYKGISENCGPCEDSCPKSILLLLTDTDNEYAKEWRERCWNNIYNKKPTLTSVKIGQVIEFQFGNETIRAEKMAPAYQFKTPWYKVVGQNMCVRKSHIHDWKIVQ